MQIDTDALRRLMALHFMGASDLARATGVSRQTIYRILRGESNPKPQNLKKICEALECGPLEIFKDI